MKITVVDRETHILFSNESQPILDVLRAGGFFIESPCGGKGTCGKCRVEIVRPDGTTESVLACKYIPDQDVTVLLKKSYTGIKKPLFDNVARAERYDLALDLGTTTLVFAFINKGKKVYEVSLPNPQRAYGADVATRISYARRDLTAMYECLYKTVNETVDAFIGANEGARIGKLFITGNTTMLHIATKTDPTSLGVYPYTPVFKECRCFEGVTLGLHAEKVIVAPVFSAFAGGDSVCATLAVALKDGEMLVDIGTNCEIVLRDGDIYRTASAPAGPALECANIECGVTFKDGAIRHVDLIDGKVMIQTVNDERPVGLVGSGLFDAISVMLKLGVIDQSGAFVNGDKYFVAPNVYVSQKDVRNFQLAVSAVRTSIETILKKVSSKKIARVYIAGAFGSSLNLESAFSTGLLPNDIKGKTVFSGNAALDGAVRCLLNEESTVALCDVALRAENVDLASDESFNNSFIKNLTFP